MRQHNIGLGPFLDTLEQRLDALSADQLREILLAHATGLHAGDRAGFLALFTRPSSTAQPPSTTHPTGGSEDAVDRQLLDDIEEFVIDIEAGVYVDGWGYDPDYHEHRAFGDETWTFTLDDLLKRSGTALLLGEEATARAAFRRLFDVMLDEHEEGGFPGAGTPDQLISTDIDEAKHRYLRAVWDSEPPKTRAAALLEAVQATTYLGAAPTLAAVEATRREPLADLDRVLPDLMAQLAAVPASYGFGTHARRLLTEATERSAGVDGLAVLARTRGEHQAEAYGDWIDGLVRVGRLDDARQAAREALDQLDLDGRVVARIAERRALLAAADRDDAAVLEAHRIAWRAEPTLDRLLAVVDIAAALDMLDPVLCEESDRTQHEPDPRRRDLTASLLLLAGRVDDAVALIDAAQPCGWDYGLQPAGVVIAFLLTGASDAVHHEAWEGSLLHVLLERADSIGWHGDAIGVDDGLGVLQAALEEANLPTALDGERAMPAEDLELSVQLLASLERHPPSPLARLEWVAAARRLVDARIDDVVGGQHRSAYGRVAQLGATCAEALTLTSGAQEAAGYLDGLHARYPRHSLFRRELRNAIEASQLLR